MRRWTYLTKAIETQAGMRRRLCQSRTGLAAQRRNFARRRPTSVARWRSSRISRSALRAWRGVFPGARGRRIDRTFRSARSNRRGLFAKRSTARVAHLRTGAFRSGADYLDRAVSHAEPPRCAPRRNYRLGNRHAAAGASTTRRSTVSIRALEYDPDHCDARNNRGHALMQNRATAQRAIIGFDEVLQRDERHITAFANRLMAMHYLENVTNADMLAAAPIRPAPHRPLSEAVARRVAFARSASGVSDRLCLRRFQRHPVAMFLMQRARPTHDRNAFESPAYYNDFRFDDYTENSRITATMAGHPGRRR